jgi:hypothetical protein
MRYAFAMRCRWLSVAAVILAGCEFNTTVPLEAVITCEGQGDCPAGWRCSSFRKQCQLRDDSDLIARALSATVSRERLRPGEEATVTVTADEPLSGAATVEARTGSSLRSLTADPSGAFVFTAASDEADGLVRFFRAAADRVGNESQGIFLGTVLIDGTPPQVTSVRGPTRAARSLRHPVSAHSPG